MWKRSVMVGGKLGEFTHTLITATFDWDSGDPDAGIPPGFGEHTCAEIKAGPFITFITWRDHSFKVWRTSRGRRSCERIKVDSADPATWVVDNIDADYRGDLPLASYELSTENPARILRLAEIPEVLDVVQEAFDDYNASERLSTAQENVQMLEAEVDAVQWHMTAAPEDEEPNPTEHDTLKLEELTQALSEAREEAQAAHDHARARGLQS